jgi:hypothetical protein
MQAVEKIPTNAANRPGRAESTPTINSALLSEFGEFAESIGRRVLQGKSVMNGFAGL